MEHVEKDILTMLAARDSLAPIERLDALIDTDELPVVREPLEVLLLTLEAIDTTVTELLVKRTLDSSRNFYIYQDQSVKLLMSQVGQGQLDHPQLIKNLILLNETDLIFRFTAARKFRITDSSDKQLRINSWGKRYIQEKKLIKRHGTVYAQLLDQMKAYVIHDQATYQEVVQLLSCPIQPQTAKRIIELNMSLTIKLLS